MRTQYWKVTEKSGSVHYVSGDRSEVSKWYPGSSITELTKEEYWEAVMYEL